MKRADKKWRWHEPCLSSDWLMCFQPSLSSKPFLTVGSHQKIWKSQGLMENDKTRYIIFQCDTKGWLSTELEIVPCKLCASHLKLNESLRSDASAIFAPRPERLPPAERLQSGDVRQNTPLNAKWLQTVNMMKIRLSTLDSHSLDFSVWVPDDFASERNAIFSPKEIPFSKHRSANANINAAAKTPEDYMP